MQGQDTIEVIGNEIDRCGEVIADLRSTLCSSVSALQTMMEPLFESKPVYNKLR